MRWNTVTLYSRGGTPAVPHWIGKEVEAYFIRSWGLGLSTYGEKGERVSTAYIPLQPGRVAQEELEWKGGFTLLPGDYLCQGAELPEEIFGEVRKTLPEALRITAVTQRVHGGRLDHWEAELE